MSPDSRVAVKFGTCLKGTRKSIATFLFKEGGNAYMEFSG